MKAKELGRSGVRLVSEAFYVEPKTVRKGKEELAFLSDIPVKRIRKPGGGVKKLAIHSDWLVLFDKIVEPKTAGLPQKEMLDRLI